MTARQAVHLSSRAAVAVVLSAVLAALVGCSAAGRPTGPDQAAAAAPAAPAVSPAPSASGLLGSHPATLAAARAETALPVAIQVPGYPGFSPVQAFVTDPVTRGLTLPTNARTVAWWAGGTIPGEATGTAVLAAHVSFNGSRGPFSDLQSFATGAAIRVRRADGSVRTFRVVGRRQFVKSALDRQDLFRTVGPPQLALVTCGGAYDRATRNFADNIVVYAVPDA